MSVLYPPHDMLNIITQYSKPIHVFNTLIIGLEYYREHFSQLITYWFMTRANISVKELNKIPMFIPTKIKCKGWCGLQDKYLRGIHFITCRQIININPQLIHAKIDYEYDYIGYFEYHLEFRKFRFKYFDYEINKIDDYRLVAKIEEIKSCFPRDIINKIHYDSRLRLFE